jgi:hypothetical protein
LDPRLVGSNPAESNGFFLRVIKICSMTSFRGEVKPLVPCCKFLRYVKDLLRYERDTYRQNSVAISHPVSPHFNIRCACCNQSTEFWWIQLEVKEKIIILNYCEGLCT